jgi:diadenosine tetraphosphate (Ap4A) HIT family hydrolase
MFILTYANSIRMTLILETETYLVGARDRPHVTRADGGHIKIKPKERYVDRQDLSPKQAIELMRLTMVVGDAMRTVLNKRGIDIGRINYQDNGNWSVFKPKGPYLHVHLYGRSKNAATQKYGDALEFPHRETGFYDGYEILTEEDVTEIQAEIENLMMQDKYLDSAWGL